MGYFDLVDGDSFFTEISTPIPFNQWAGRFDRLCARIGFSKSDDDLVTFTRDWVYRKHGDTAADAGRAIFHAVKEYCLQRHKDPNPHIDSSEDCAWKLIDRIYGGKPYGRDYSNFQPKPYDKTWDCAKSLNFNQSLTKDQWDKYHNAQKLIQDNISNTFYCTFLVNVLSEEIGIPTWMLGCFSGMDHV